MTLSEGARAFLERSVGVWEIDGDRYAVFENSAGGLGAVELATGKPVGAGLPISGNKVGPLPADFKAPTGV